MMAAPAVPKSWYLPSKPHKFCPGCGHGIVLKALGEVIDELDIQTIPSLDVISVVPYYPGTFF